ncbi:hypothetical protein [Herpetosiphon gulosus]|uniref:Lipoprotein n=1 Tax=Herpetosiphon gulosus TaxID=1973496 RepID=A0ABP9X4D8_9CHLR
MRSTVFGCVLVAFGLISCASPSVAPAQVAAIPSATPAPTPTEVLPACFTEVPALPPQPELAAIPLPPTTRIKGRFEKDTGPITFIGGVIGDPDAIAAFFESNLPVAGFSIDYADSEPGESDGIFSKDGQSFRWHLVAQTHCPEVTALQMLINREE